MKLFIETRGKNSEQQLLHLKKYVEEQRISELESLGFERKKAKKGEMGSGGAIGTLTAVLVGLAGPVSRLAQSLTKYASSFRTEIIIKNEFGDELVLNTKRIDREGIELLVDKFLIKEKAKPNARNTRAKK